MSTLTFKVAAPSWVPETKKKARWVVGGKIRKAKLGVHSSENIEEEGTTDLTILMTGVQ